MQQQAKRFQAAVCTLVIYVARLVVLPDGWQQLQSIVVLLQLLVSCGWHVPPKPTWVSANWSACTMVSNKNRLLR